MTDRSLAAVFGLMLALAGPQVAAEVSGMSASLAPSLSGALGLGFDSNVGNTPSGNEPRSEGVLDGGLAATWRIDQGLFTAWQVRGSLDASGYAPTSDLSEARAALRLRWTHRPGSGFFAPVLAAWASAGARVSASELRGGADYRTGAYLREQLTNAVSARLGFTFSRRDSESRVYDLTNRSITLGFDWAFSPTLTLYSELEHFNGQIVSSVVDDEDLISPRQKSYHYLVPLAEETEADEAYGSNWYALKVPATGNLLALGANVPIGSRWSLDSRLQYGLIDVTGVPLSYGRGQLALTMLRRF